MSIVRLLMGLATLWMLSACAPLVVGAAGAVIVDEVAENEQGGDGLF